MCIGRQKKNKIVPHSACSYTPSHISLVYTHVRLHTLATHYSARHPLACLFRSPVLAVRHACHLAACHPLICPPARPLGSVLPLIRNCTLFAHSHSTFSDLLTHQPSPRSVRSVLRIPSRPSTFPSPSPLTCPLDSVLPLPLISCVLSHSTFSSLVWRLKLAPVGNLDQLSSRTDR